MQLHLATAQTPNYSNGNANTNPTGPLLIKSWADPSIIKVNNTFYSYATNHYKGGNTINVPVASFVDFKSGWHVIDRLDALPFAGTWTKQPNAQVWAPDINQLVCPLEPIYGEISIQPREKNVLNLSQGDGSFVMYYAAENNTSRLVHCVGAATSKAVTGPFKPNSAHPLICPEEGAIDPNGFTHNGRRYIVYKKGHAWAHNNKNSPTSIMLQQTKADGLTFISSPVELLRSTIIGGNDTESPALVESPNGGFVLYYVNHNFQETTYSIQYATADTLTGKYSRRGALLRTGQYDGVNLSEPGGPDFVDPEHMIFMSNAEYEYNGTRLLHAAVLQYEGRTNVTLA